MKEKKGYKKTKLGWIPVEWQIFKLEDIVEKNRKISYGIVQTGRPVKNGIKCVRVVDIVNGKIEPKKLITTSVKISDSYKKTILKKGDLIIALRGKIGQLSIIGEELVGANLTRGVALLAVDDRFFNEFIYHQLSSPQSEIIMTKQLNGSALKELSIGVLRKIPISIPPLPEQQKIAAILSTWDKAIEGTQQLIEAKEEQKKGLMQRLLTGKVRVKGFEGEWEEVRLGEVAKYYDGTHQTPKYVKKGIPFYSVEHVTANQFSRTKYISKEVFEKETKRVKLEKGDILMTRIGSIGIAKHIDWEVKASFYVSLALIKRKDSFDSNFLSYAINAKAFQRELWKRTIHVAFPKKINLGEIGECNLWLPPLPEQTAIAQILSTTDGEITMLMSKLEALKEQKKGLMQQLLTGKIRVKID